jgi:hypothetical protein
MAGEMKVYVGIGFFYFPWHKRDIPIYKENKVQPRQMRTVVKTFRKIAFPRRNLTYPMI